MIPNVKVSILASSYPHNLMRGASFYEARVSASLNIKFRISDFIFY